MTPFTNRDPRAVKQRPGYADDTWVDRPARLRAAVAPARTRAAAARAAGLLLVLAMVAGLSGQSLQVAHADAELDQARADAHAAAAEVDALAPGVENALRRFDVAMAELGSGVSRSISAEQAADLAAMQSAADRRTAGTRIRALYMAGGSTALVASILSADGATDALRRVAYVQRLVSVGVADAAAGQARTEDLRARAAGLQQAAAARTTTVADVQRRYDDLVTALATATDRLARLSSRAHGLAEAQAAAARIAALNAQVDAAGAAQVSTAHASDVVPADYLTLYHSAARTCPGMSWTLLAAIGQVESGHGANTSSSYAGAQGPMQFLPATFHSYAVDGDHDGATDIQSPPDAIFTAARYLCANGAGRDENSTARAVWHYNHADWYVALVIKLAGQYAAKDVPAAG